MIISDIVEELEIELIALSLQKGSKKKIQERIIKALKDYLDAKNIDLKDYIDISNYIKIMEITKPKDKQETEQLELQNPEI